MSRRALITGINGQDGAYLAKLLLDKGYTVIGGSRESDRTAGWRLKALGIADRISLVPFDLLAPDQMRAAIIRSAPTELYNLAAQTVAAVPFDRAVETANADAMAVLHILEILRTTSSDCRFFQASSAEMFGANSGQALSEESPFRPRSPYGVAKLFAHWMTMTYGISAKLFASSGILFNHESPFRGDAFVTRKITSGLARFKLLAGPPLQLGNLDSERDWGFAGDYVEAMWLTLQQQRGDAYVLATGQKRTVRQFVETAASAIGLNVRWDGKGVEEKGVDSASGRIMVEINQQFYRPGAVDKLLGDSSRAKRCLGWQPRTTFEELVGMMVRADYERAEAGY